MIVEGQIDISRKFRRTEVYNFVYTDKKFFVVVQQYSVYVTVICK